MVVSARAKVERGSSGTARWELAARPLPAVLRPWVTKCDGYGEWSGAPVARREIPMPRVVVILEFDTPIGLHDPADEAKRTTFKGGFVAGLDDRSTLTTHDGIQRGIQIDLTPTAARRCFDRPMSELLGQVVPLVELLPRAERHLCERLAALPDWDARLEIVEALLAERITACRADTRVAEWATRRIEACGGGLDLNTLARELGYSPKHVISLFHEHVGMTPKRFARVVRFDRLARHLRSGGTGSWAELAARFGWFDQAHLSNDVKRMTRGSPSELRELLAGPAGVNFFQDASGNAA
ncbi:MAG TPA: helix-turn-helix domain-containing protein [Polyangiaceae bacterium]|nr:helix-turn-helix domain-containing protein [Polyangiaceae bacterium]